MPEPGPQERLRAVLTDQRLTADDPRLPLPAFLECNLPLSALPAENPLAWRALGEKRLAADAVEPTPTCCLLRERDPGEKNSLEGAGV
jgi:hypothetical protein